MAGIHTAHRPAGRERIKGPMSTSTSPPEGRRNVTLGRFRVLSHIATGGMGAVYRAFDPDTNREVALKVLLPDLVASKPVLVERLRREAQHGARLRHENLVSLYEFVEAAGTCFLVMELVEGQNLHDLITARGPLFPEEARRLLIQVVRALDYVYRQGIVHRDIKPANILLAQKDGTTLAKLTDLGLAREARDEDFRLTREGCTVGTIDYMAPEQARNSASADIRSDIYALGCTFFHMLTGRPPFPEGSLPERIYKHAEAEPPDVRSLNPAVSAGLALVVRRMLAKAPADRYQTPGDLLDDLLHEPAASAEAPVVAALPPSGEAPSTDTLPATGTSIPAAAPPPPAEAPSPVGSADIVSGQLAYARELITRGNYDVGIGLLLSCCKIDPGNVDLHRALRAAVRGREARGHDDGWLTWLRGQMARLRFKLRKRSGQHAQVLACGAEVLARRPDDLEAQLDMADAAEELGQGELALWLLVEAWKGQEQSAPVNRALGRYFEKRKDYEQALAYWTRVVQAAPNDSEARKKLRDLAALQTLIRAKRAKGGRQ